MSKDKKHHNKEHKHHKDHNNENDMSQAEEMDKVAELENEVAEQKDKYLRLYSEFDNYRRRTSKERLELLKTAGEDVLTSLLPVIDDFERARKSMEDTDDISSVKEGIDLVYVKFLNTLTHQGLEPFDSIGEEFDADLHEAVTKIPAPSADMKGKIVDEIEKGYKLNDKVIRYAKVVVGE